MNTTPHQDDRLNAPPEDREIRAQRERDILLLALKAGQILLENGAEIFRVEDTVYRICHYYGLHSANVFVLSNGIFLTSGDEKETQFAKVLQIPVNVANLSRVAEVNQLSRQIEAGRFTPEEAKLQLERIENTPGFSNRIQIISAGFSGACFSFMFGGALQDFFCSIWIGMILQLYLVKIAKPHFSKIVCNITGSALVTALSIFFYQTGLGLHLESMMIGGIILMVPGVAFTNAIRDMADEDYISGSVRMLDAILVFLCIAMGVGFVIALWNQITGGIHCSMPREDDGTVIFLRKCNHAFFNMLRPYRNQDSRSLANCCFLCFRVIPYNDKTVLQFIVVKLCFRNRNDACLSVKMIRFIHVYHFPAHRFRDIFRRSLLQKLNSDSSISQTNRSEVLIW